MKHPYDPEELDRRATAADGMTHKRIADVRLLPRHVPVRCHGVHGCKLDATDWVVSPDGFAILATCRKHGDDINAEYREKLAENWTLAPIYHDARDNTTHDRENAP